MLPKPQVPHHIVTAAVIRRNGRVLIAQRPPDKLLGGLWEFPGGKVNPGEDLLAGLKREIREELGVEISVQGALGKYKHAYTHFRVSVHAFCCALEAGEPHNLEHTGLRWARPSQLSGYPMGKIDRQIARQIASHLSGSCCS
jgi:A/G-specific adenine glycosylase